MIDDTQRERLQALARIVQKELLHLQRTDTRLFAEPFTADKAAGLEENQDLAERVEAFVSRFGRLQDTLGDKLLPRYLAALGERPLAFIDNLAKAERLGLINSADHWLELRRLRNRMIHEYVDDPKLLAEALQAGHRGVAELARAARRILDDLKRRGLI